jgi:hypothetical protein
MNRSEVILFDAEYPWGFRVCAICEAIGFQAKSMRLATGFVLVDWGQVAAVVLQATQNTGPAVLDAIDFLQANQRQVKSLVHLGDRPDEAWIYHEAGAVWTFSSLLELDPVERILTRIRRPWRTSLE